jgi:hypothetical protein
MLNLRARMPNNKHFICQSSRTLSKVAPYGWIAWVHTGTKPNRRRENAGPVSLRNSWPFALLLDLSIAPV